MITLLIGILATLSYIVGARAIFRGEYQPSIYSRIVWFLTELNSLAGVVLLHNQPGTVVLVAVSTLGCLVILIGALKYSIRTFGRIELICTILLAISGLLWIVAPNPLLSIILGLTADLIGGVPTFVRAVNNPKSEHVLFWLFFALASGLALLQADKTSPPSYLYATFFVLHDGAMTLLAARQYLQKM